VLTAAAAGVFVGLRYNAPDISGSSGAAGRRSGKWASLTLASAAPMDGARIVDIRSECIDARVVALWSCGHGSHSGADPTWHTWHTGLCQGSAWCFVRGCKLVLGFMSCRQLSWLVVQLRTLDHVSPLHDSRHTVAHYCCVCPAGPLGDASGLALQHLGPELSSSGTGRGWGSSNTITTAPYMQVSTCLKALQVLQLAHRQDFSVQSTCIC
jgi:hypothetical protein